MPVEVVNTINDLNENYPLPGDGVNAGDDHIRLIKRAVKDTFPNIDKPVTKTADELNTVVGFPNVTGQIDATDEDLNRKISMGTDAPTGGKDGDVYFQYEGVAP